MVTTVGDMLCARVTFWSLLVEGHELGKSVVRVFVCQKFEVRSSELRGSVKIVHLLDWLRF